LPLVDRLLVALVPDLAEDSVERDGRMARGDVPLSALLGAQRDDAVDARRQDHSLDWVAAVEAHVGDALVTGDVEQPHLTAAVADARQAAARRDVDRRHRRVLGPFKSMAAHELHAVNSTGFLRFDREPGAEGARGVTDEDGRSADQLIDRGNARPLTVE